MAHLHSPTRIISCTASLYIAILFQISFSACIRMNMVVIDVIAVMAVQGMALDPSGMSVPSFQPFYQQQQQPQRQQQQSPRGHGAGSDYVQSVSPAHSPTHMMSTAQPIPSVTFYFQMHPFGISVFLV